MAILGAMGILALLALVQAVFMGLAIAQSSGPADQLGGSNWTSPGVYPARTSPAKKSLRWLTAISEWRRTRQLGRCIHQSPSVGVPDDPPRKGAPSFTAPS